MAARLRKPSPASTAGAKSRKASSPKSSSTPSNPNPSPFTVCSCIAPVDAILKSAVVGAQHAAPLLGTIKAPHRTTIRRFFKQLFHRPLQTLVHRLRHVRGFNRIGAVKQDVHIDQPRPFRHQLLAPHS